MFDSAPFPNRQVDRKSCPLHNPSNVLKLEIRERENKEDHMNTARILQGKHAVIFGAGGSIGAAVAAEFSAQGAEVFLSGRTQSSVEAVAKKITAEAGLAHAAAIDTLDEDAVNQYIDGIVNQTGKVDIVLDAAGPLAREYGNERMPSSCRSRSSWCH